METRQTQTAKGAPRAFHSGRTGLPKAKGDDLQEQAEQQTAKLALERQMMETGHGPEHEYIAEPARDSGSTTSFLQPCCTCPSPW